MGSNQAGSGKMIDRRETVGQPVTPSAAPAADDAFYCGLQAIAESSFPKYCASCGRIFKDADEYVAATGRVGCGHSGLKQTLDDDGQVIVELFRNCVCGSTLMDAFADRRNTSESGIRRRTRFGELVELLVSRGLTRDIARCELLKVMKGQASSILQAKRPPSSGPQ